MVYHLNQGIGRRGLMRGVALVGGVAGAGLLAACSRASTQASSTPAAPESPKADTISPDVGKTPEAGSLPTTEQLAGFTPEQIMQSIQDYLGVSKTPAEYAQGRVDVINMIMQAGCTKAEVDEHMYAANSNAGTFSAYINERYVKPFDRAIEASGERNESAVIAWYETFFSAPHMRGAASLELESATPYRAIATIGDISVTKGSADSTKSPFTVSFATTITDNFKESGVGALFPRSEEPLDTAYTFTTDVVPSEKDSKTVLTSTGTSMTRTK